jgi:hypothetical protein
MIFKSVLKKLCKASDGAKRISNFMGKASGKLSNGSELFRSSDFFLQSLNLA